MQLNRVLIDKEGTAVPPKRAKELGVSPDVIFIRDDGWTLGAPKHLKDVAHSLWSDKWVGVIKVQ